MSSVTVWLRRISEPSGRADLGQAEIENFGVSAIGDEDIRRLDVAMNDALGMSGIERVGNLDAEVNTSDRFEGLPDDGFPQRLCLPDTPSR